MKKFTFAFMALIAAACMLTACTKEDEPKGGTFKVRMTDAPADYEALSMTLVSVEAYHESKGWVTLEADSKELDVLSLTNGREETIAFDASAESGTYSMLRLRFSDESSLEVQKATTVGGVTSVSTVSASLSWNGAREVLIPINVNVSSEIGVDLLLDFNVAESILEVSSSYVIQPAIEVMTNTTTGIEGKVNGSAHALIIVSNSNGSASTYIDANGDFLIRGIEDGTYTVTVISSAADRAAGAPEQIEISGVVVTKGAFTSTGTINLE